MHHSIIVLANLLTKGHSLATPLIPRQLGPTVQLDNAIFVGLNSGPVNQFLGVPFARPPTGSLRFNLPQPNDPYSGTQTATAYGHACPQQDSNVTVPLSELDPVTIAYIAASTPPPVTDENEDCLTINVIAPASVAPGAQLPVVAWIYGGAFEVGVSSSMNGSVIVERSIEMEQPVVFVSMNYRGTAFGFIGGEEVKSAGVGNLGLRDQRLALRWVKKYITSFGGDPSQVTIWGLSAGAISCSLQMLTNGGDNEGLFRAAMMHSGSPIPVGDISYGQPYYDALVKQTGCSGASDTLQCLREVDYATLKAAVDASPSSGSYQSLNLAWLPRVDSDFLVDIPMNLVQQGSVARIPVISGDVDDEGTAFALSSLNVTDDAGMREFVTQVYFPDASSDEIDELLTLYPADITQGSPFGTGTANALTPEYKRISAFTGDLIFQAPRRFFLQHIAGTQNVWSFLSKHEKSLPDVGSAHGTDTESAWGSGDLTDYLINFVNTLNPNRANSFNWPQYTYSSSQLLTLSDNATDYSISQDTYRAEQFAFLSQLSLEHPIGPIGL